MKSLKFMGILAFLSVVISTAGVTNSYAWRYIECCANVDLGFGRTKDPVCFQRKCTDNYFERIFYGITACHRLPYQCDGFKL